MVLASTERATFKTRSEATDKGVAKNPVNTQKASMIRNRFPISILLDMNKIGRRISAKRGVGWTLRQRKFP